LLDFRYDIKFSFARLSNQSACHLHPDMMSQGSEQNFTSLMDGLGYEVDLYTRRYLGSFAGR
jgi:hypothetical protein